MTEYYPAKTVAATFFRTPFIGTELINFLHLETTNTKQEAEGRIETFLCLSSYAPRMSSRIRDLSFTSYAESCNRAAPKARFKVKDELRYVARSGEFAPNSYNCSFVVSKRRHTFIFLSVSCWSSCVLLVSGRLLSCRMSRRWLN